MRGSQTGVFVYFLFDAIFGVIGTAIALMIVRRSLRAWRNLRRALLPDQLAEYGLDLRLHIIVWSVRAAQVAISVPLYALFEADIITAGTGAIVTVILIYTAVFYMAEPVAWVILGAIELWVGRPRKRAR